jgi:hypothetical protein
MYKYKIIFFCRFGQVLGFACGTRSLEENNFPSPWKGHGFACGTRNLEENNFPSPSVVILSFPVREKIKW